MLPIHQCGIGRRSVSRTRSISSTQKRRDPVSLISDYNYSGGPCRLCSDSNGVKAIVLLLHQWTIWSGRVVLPHLPPQSHRGTLLVELRPDVCCPSCGLRVPGWARTSVNGFAGRCMYPLCHGNTESTQAMLSTFCSSIRFSRCSSFCRSVLLVSSCLLFVPSCSSCRSSFRSPSGSLPFRLPEGLCAGRLRALAGGEEEGGGKPSFWPSAPESLNLLVSLLWWHRAWGASDAFVSVAYGIGGEVVSVATGMVCWSHPNANAHTGMATIVAMVGMAMVVMVVVAVMSDGTSSGGSRLGASLSRALW